MDLVLASVDQMNWHGQWSGILMEGFAKGQDSLEMKDACCWETVLHGSSFPACFLNRTSPDCLFKNVCNSLGRLRQSKEQI